MRETPQSAETAQMSEAEEYLWDELWDTDAARCCSCPSCNFYAPDYEQHKDEPCVLRTITERIIAARLAPVVALADGWQRDVDILRADAIRDGDVEADWHASARQQHLDQLRSALRYPPGVSSDGGDRP